MFSAIFLHHLLTQLIHCLKMTDDQHGMLVESDGEVCEEIEHPIQNNKPMKDTFPVCTPESGELSFEEQESETPVQDEPQTEPGNLVDDDKCINKNNDHNKEVNDLGSDDGNDDDDDADDLENDDGTDNDDHVDEQENKTNNTGENETEREELEDGEHSTDGELLEDDDIEEGEIQEYSVRKTFTKPLCRFFMRGSCTWGMNCRFLHPGVNDKGHSHDDGKPVSSFDLPPQPPVSSWSHNERPFDAEHTAFPSPSKAPESAWERGLRHAKEIKKLASIRKENEPDFEEKKLNLTTMKELEEDKVDREEVDEIYNEDYNRRDEEDYYTHNNDWQHRPVEENWARNSENYYAVPPSNRLKGQWQDHAKFSMNKRHCDVKPKSPILPHGDGETFPRTISNLEVGSYNQAGFRGRGEEWRDPWLRTRRSRHQTHSSSGSHSVMHCSNSSYSSSSCSSRSRSSSSSSCSSYTSRSYSSSSSSSRSRSSTSRSAGYAIRKPLGVGQGHQPTKPDSNDTRKIGTRKQVSLPSVNEEKPTISVSKEIYRSLIADQNVSKTEANGKPRDVLQPSNNVKPEAWKIAPISLVGSRPRLPTASHSLAFQSDEEEHVKRNSDTSLSDSESSDSKSSAATADSGHLYRDIASPISSTSTASPVATGLQQIIKGMPPTHDSYETLPCEMRYITAKRDPPAARRQVPDKPAPSKPAYRTNSDRTTSHMTSHRTANLQPRVNTVQSRSGASSYHSSRLRMKAGGGGYLEKDYHQQGTSYRKTKHEQYFKSTLSDNRSMKLTKEYQMDNDFKKATERPIMKVHRSVEQHNEYTKRRSDDDYPPPSKRLRNDNLEPVKISLPIHNRVSKGAVSSKGPQGQDTKNASPLKRRGASSRKQELLQQLQAVEDAIAKKRSKI